MPEFVVTWDIVVEADNHKAAAEEARKIQRDPDNEATVFQVEQINPRATEYVGRVEVDLEEP